MAGDAVWSSSDESVITIERGDIHAKKEGTVTVSGVYTDGTGKTFNASFTMSSQLFPLMAGGVLNDLEFGASYDENTQTFSGSGSCEWSYAADPNVTPGAPVRQYNYVGGVDLSAYNYIVVRLSQPSESTAFWLRDSWDGDPKVWVALVDKTEFVIDLHQEGFDPSHILRAGFWMYESSLSVQEVFLSNDGVNPAPPYTIPTIVKADDVSMFYGDEVPELTYTIGGSSYEGRPTLTTTATKNSPVGTYDILSSGSQDGVTYKPGKLTIVPAPLTVTAADIVIGAGMDIPALTLTYEGFRNGDTEDTALSEKPTVATTATKDSPCGNYEISVSGGSAANYDIGCYGGTLTITPDLTIALPTAQTA